MPQCFGQMGEAIMIYAILILSPIFAFYLFVKLANFAFRKYVEHIESREVETAHKQRQWDMGMRR